MHKKQIACISALLVLGLAALLAQGGQKRELTYWTPFTGGDGDYFQAMIDAFNASQSRISMRTAQIKAASYYVKLEEVLESGEAPDVFIVTKQRAADYAARGLILPLDAPLKRAGIPPSSFEENVLAGYTVGGKIYAVPWGAHPIIMYYNKSLFAKAGVAKVPGSLAELVAAAKAIQEKTGAIGIAADNTAAKYKVFTQARMFLSLLKQGGKDSLDPTATRAAFNNPAGIKAYQLLSDLANKYKVEPKGLDYDFAVEYFRTGKAGIHFNGVWVTGLFESQADLDFGAVEFPPLMGKSASWFSTDAFAVAERTGSDEAKTADIMAFLDWMTSHGELWAKAGHLPTRKTVYAKADFKKLPHIAEYANARRNSFEPPDTPKWPLCFAAMADSLEQSIARNDDAKTALAEMERKVNEALK
jgi:multiple sugar transport system substrate-binding protein